MKPIRMHPFVIVVGIAAISMLFIIFTPSIFGVASGSYDVTKYNGTSAQGTALVQDQLGVSRILVLQTTYQFQLAALLSGIFAIIVVVWWAHSRLNKKRSGGKRAHY